MSVDTGFSLLSYHVAPTDLGALSSGSEVRDSRQRPDWVTEIPLTLEYLLTTLEPGAGDLLGAACRGLQPLVQLSDEFNEYGVVPAPSVPPVAAALRELDVEDFISRASGLDLEELVEVENLWDVEMWTYDPDFDIGAALTHILERLRNTFQQASAQGQAVVVQRSYPT